MKTAYSDQNVNFSVPIKRLHLFLLCLFVLYIYIRFIYYLMATAGIASSDKDDFEDEISKTKKEIETFFCQLMDCLKERKEKLMKDLEEILSSHKRERDTPKQSITGLERMLECAKDEVKYENLKGIQSSIIEQLSEKRKEFESESESKHISLDFDKTILELAGTIGRLTVTNSTSVVSSLPVVDYEGKVTPVLSIGGTSGGICLGGAVVRAFEYQDLGRGF